MRLWSTTTFATQRYAAGLTQDAYHDLHGLPFGSYKIDVQYAKVRRRTNVVQAVGACPLGRTAPPLAVAAPQREEV